MTWVVVGAIAVLAVTSLLRLRKGGPGPAVNWVPRALCGRTNDFYQRHGWSAPYDESGNKRPGRHAM